MSNRFGIACIAICLAALVGAVGGFMWPSTGPILPIVAEGQAPLPVVSLPTLKGGSETLADYRGKVVVLNVWATWCAPCRAELPSLQRLSERLPEEQFRVLGVSVDADADKVREFLAERKITFSRHIDSAQRFTKGVLGIQQLPATIVFDQTGAIVARVIGARPWDREDFVNRLRGLTRASSATTPETGTAGGGRS